MKEEEQEEIEGDSKGKGERAKHMLNDKKYIQGGSAIIYIY